MALKIKLFTIYVFFQTLVCGCAQDKNRSGFQVATQRYEIKKVGKMAKEEIQESSGFELSDDGYFWTHADGGNDPTLYKINKTGKLISTADIPHTVNFDWEDLAKDDRGHLYIGDFGNNENKRKNLRVFRVKENDKNQVDTIQFQYPDQKAFPPPKSERNFDCEAFFYYDDNLYLFSKNRGDKELVKVYRVPAQPGKYVAQLVDSMALNNWITAADISPDGKTVALLGYGNLYVLEIKNINRLFDGAKYCIPFEQSGQAEALVFINNTDFIFSNEAGKIFEAVKKNK